MSRFGVVGECTKGHGPKWWRYSNGNSGKGWCVICNNEAHRKRYAANKANRSLPENGTVTANHAQPEAKQNTEHKGQEGK